MKYIFCLLFSTMLLSYSKSQDSVTLAPSSTTTFKLYSPYENADSALKVVLAKAKKEGKNVFVQIGGNWCSWCKLFNEFVTKDAQLDSAINTNYIVYHLNYSQENLNKKILAEFKFPQRFGFPVFIILNKNGEQLHTQNSAYLEQGKSYNKDKIIEFLDQWSPHAFNPAQYKNY